MNTTPHDDNGTESGFTSHTCEDIIFDGPGDNTVRPLEGEHRKLAMAERDKIAHWEALGFSSTPSREQIQSVGSTFTSFTCEDIIFDGPGDNTVRPLEGEHRKRAMAERERIRYWESLGYSAFPPKKEPPPQS